MAFQDAYEKHSKGNGCLKAKLLREALRDASYAVNKNIVALLVLRYSRNGFIYLEDFIGIAVKLRCMIGRIRSHSFGIAQMGHCVSERYYFHFRNFPGTTDSPWGIAGHHSRRGEFTIFHPSGQ